jgi:4-oxalocrotonate tautomerase
MPLAQIYIAKGRSHEQKKKLIENVTQAFVDSLGTKPDSVWVVINEVARSDWGTGGVPLGAPDKT